MLDRLGGMNSTGHQEVLPKVFTLGRAALFIAVIQVGDKLHITREAMSDVIQMSAEWLKSKLTRTDIKNAMPRRNLLKPGG